MASLHGKRGISYVCGFVTGQCGFATWLCGFVTGQKSSVTWQCGFATSLKRLRYMTKALIGWYIVFSLCGFATWQYVFILFDMVCKFVYLCGFATWQNGRMAKWINTYVASLHGKMDKWQNTKVASLHGKL